MRGDIYTPEMVADMWGCSAQHVRNLINRGELRAMRLGSRLIRIPAKAVEDYEQCASTGLAASTGDTSSPGGRPVSVDAIVLTVPASLTRNGKRST